MSQGMQERKHILIVEDDPDIGLMLTILIETETAYESTLVSDTQTALQQARRIRPDLYLLNYSLDSMNGIQLYDRLRQIPGQESVPALMMSANLPKQDLADRNIIGINKPFDLGTMLDHIEATLADANRTR